MEKKLIILVVPALENTKYDVFVPSFLKIKQVIALCSEALANLTQNQFVASGGEVLCRTNPHEILNQEMTLDDCGIRHGDQLYLF